MIYYRINVLEALNKQGYSVVRLQKDRLLGSSTITKLNNCKGLPVTGERSLSISNIDKICALLDCQPGEFLEYRKS